ncbi:exopolysaccharide biosynthesis polyprenyl glycosylphosphotransferase [Sphingomonas sp. MS122]|uniref:exopolysaccharide biosynthesis polyprenyl glycosylphosphotransferase n=1 Tax=Sphingomonas sp. MS122 TaxID=3412683 RepID=UPI003C2D16E5
MNYSQKTAQWGLNAAKPSSKWRAASGVGNARLIAGLFLLDIACIMLSFLAAGELYGTVGVTHNTGWILIAGILTPIYLVSASNLHAYSVEALENRYLSITRSVRAFLTALCIVILVAFVLKTSAQFSRLTLGFGAGLSILSLAVARYGFTHFLRQSRGAAIHSTVLICDAGQQVPESDFSVLMAADFDLDPDKHDPLMYDRLSKALGTADRVVVACRPERRIAWASALKGANIQSEMLIPELAELAPLGVARHGPMPTVIVSTGPLDLLDRVIKRGFDVAVAGSALVLLSPLFLIVAALIKLDSDGPVFFKQVRIGRGNEMFSMFKFRSMRVETLDGAGNRSTSRDDDRITKVGAFIRKTSIDELPQLINVLRGEMSIVGPRPHALGSRAADKLFWEVDQRYWHRHSAKPGLTGLAQVRGYRGATFHEDDLTNRLQADLEYLDHWTIWRDIQIVLMTFRVLLHRNAF